MTLPFEQGSWWWWWWWWSAAFVTCVSIYLVAHHSSHRDQSQSRITQKLRSSPQTYRVRGIPSTYTPDHLQTILSHVLQDRGCSEPHFRVKSLAPGVSGPHLVATIDFDQVPAIFRDETGVTAWDLPLESTSLAQTQVAESLKFDIDFLGLTPLYQNHETSGPTAELDVVAVHGLGGHAFYSFKERKSTYMWLRDRVPADVPSSRLWVYGYDSPRQHSRSVQTIDDLALALASKIRELGGSQSRPSHSQSPRRLIVLIGHSLGGLIIKQALVHLNKKSSDVLRSIYALLLFGVPNQRMDAQSLLAMSEHGPGDYLIHSLQPISEVLRTQREQFAECFASMVCEIHCFYETKESPTAVKNGEKGWTMTGPVRYVVNRDSSTHFWEGDTSLVDSHPINATHSDMVKFKHLDSAEDTVLHILQNLSARSDEASQLRELQKILLSSEQQDCLRTLAFSGMGQRERDVHSGVRGTGTWLFDHPTYCHWGSANVALLILLGDPSVGKSTLMKSLTTVSMEKKGVATMTFFANAQGNPDEHSKYGMIKALLHQCAQRFPHQCANLFALHRKRELEIGRHSEKFWNWSETELSEQLHHIILAIGRDCPIELIIDALDETGPEAARSIATYLIQLVLQADASDSKLRVAFACRYYPEVKLPEGFEIHVPEHNQTDIRLFVESSRERLLDHMPSTHADRLINSVIGRAKGSFQWTALVLDLLSQELDDGATFTRLENLLDEIPPELTDFYSKLMDSIKPRDRPVCVRLLQWTAFAVQPLNLFELREALAIESEPATLRDMRAHSDFPCDFGHLKRRIRALSKGLITFDDPLQWDDSDGMSMVRFVHKSAWDFVTTVGLKQLHNSVSFPNSDELRVLAGPMNSGLTDQDLVVASAHYQISRSCLSYLGLSDVFELCENLHFDPYYELVYRIGSEKSLLSYAIQHWASHASQAEAKGRLTLPRLHDYCQAVSSKAFDAWISFQIMNNQSFAERTRTTAMHLLAAYGATTIFRWCQDQGLLGMTPDGLQQSPLFWACRCGHLKLVKLLIEFSKVGLDAKDKDGKTPLHQAAWAGHETVVQLLIEVDTGALDAKDASGTTPLHEAVSAGHEAVVKLLIGTDNVDVVTKDVSRRTLLHDAAVNGHEAIVELLFTTSKIDPRAKDESGRTPLHDASWTGHEAVVKLLLETGRVDPDAKDRSGHTPLHKAARRGHGAIVKLLFATSQVDPNARDESGRTPLHRAAVGGFEAVKLLIASSEVDLDPRDKIGQTPLHKAATDGYEAVVELLLATGKVDVNVKHLESGRTALQEATWGSATDVIRLLVATGQVHLGVTDKFGSTLLHEASWEGVYKVVELFLANGQFDPGAKDQEGRTAIDIATSQGHFDIAELLQQYQEADVKMKQGHMLST